MLSKSAVPSLSRDVATGKLVTAIHKFGPDTDCGELSNANEIKQILDKVTWRNNPMTCTAMMPIQKVQPTASRPSMAEPAMSLVPMEKGEATTSKINDSIACLDDQIRRRLNTHKLEQSMAKLSDQMEQLSFDVQNKLEVLNAAYSSSLMEPEDEKDTEHIKIPVRDMQELVAKLEEIQCAEPTGNQINMQVEDVQQLMTKLDEIQNAELSNNA